MSLLCTRCSQQTLSFARKLRRGLTTPQRKENNFISHIYESIVFHENHFGTILSIKAIIILNHLLLAPKPSGGGGATIKHTIIEILDPILNALCLWIWIISAFSTD